MNDPIPPSRGKGSIDPISLPPVLLASLSEMMPFDVEPRYDGGPQVNNDLLGVVDPHPQSAAIVLAGGQGERFGLEGGKQLVEILGKPILSWSLQSLDAVGDIGLIVLVCPEERQEEYYERAVAPYDLVTPLVMAPAGSIRQESAFAGLELVPDDYDYVVMHDGARPLISPELVLHTINVIKGNPDADGSLVAHRSIDTLKVVEDGVVVGTPDRSVFWNAQTPQAFRTGIFRRAHAAALADGFVGTDDASLIERLGGKVLVVEGQRNNIKLTVPEDYLLLVSAVKEFHNARMQKVINPDAASGPKA